MHLDCHQLKHRPYPGGNSTVWEARLVEEYYSQFRVQKKLGDNFLWEQRLGGVLPFFLRAGRCGSALFSSFFNVFK